MNCPTCGIAQACGLSPARPPFQTRPPCGCVETVYAAIRATHPRLDLKLARYWRLERGRDGVLRPIATTSKQRKNHLLGVDAIWRIASQPAVRHIRRMTP